MADNLRDDDKNPFEGKSFDEAWKQYLESLDKAEQKLKAINEDNTKHSKALFLLQQERIKALEAEYELQEEANLKAQKHGLLLDELNKKSLETEELKTKLKQASSEQERKDLEEKLALQEKELKRLNEAKKKSSLDIKKDKFNAGKEKAAEKAKDAKEQTKIGFSEIFRGEFKEGFKDVLQGFKGQLTGGYEGGAGVVKALDNIASKTADLAQKLDSTIEEIASYKSDWDTRLFGSGKGHSSISDLVSKSIGASGLVKQADVMKKLNEAIDKGISYNLEERAFLATVSENIATTFDAFDSTLLEIIRVQQADSTEARLGMEASLNQFLNEQFKNTEYLSNVSDNVTSALYEATSLMDYQDSIGFEFQAQKWLGSLYSVGMSQSGVSSISEALGGLASGNIEVLDSGAGKLLTMAASQSGQNLSEMLIDGFDGSKMNSLMQAVVQYLQTIATRNNVVQSQVAQLYGLKTSDIQAALNLKGDMNEIYNQGDSYDFSSAVAMTNSMMDSYASRISMGELMNNTLDNFKYSLSEGIASSPALYGIWSASNLLEDLVGGIGIPTIGVMGNSVDLESSVADLMQVGALSASLIGSVGNIVSALGNFGSVAGMLDTMSTDSTERLRTISRGTTVSYLNSSSSSITTSNMNYVGNSSGDDALGSEYADAEQQKNDLQVEAQEENESITMDDMYTVVTAISELLQTVVDGGSSFHVRLSGIDSMNPFE